TRLDCFADLEPAILLARPRVDDDVLLGDGFLRRIERGAILKELPVVLARDVLRLRQRDLAAADLDRPNRGAGLVTRGRRLPRRERLRVEQRSADLGRSQAGDFDGRRASAVR